MADTVLVTTHDLPLAGKLRDGFRHAGYQVELFTSAEDVTAADDAALLVFTGGTSTAAARRQAGQAAGLGAPIFAVVDPGTARAIPTTVTTTFPTPADPEEIVLVGTRLIQRTRLRNATGIVGETDAMLQVMERIVQIAPVDATVLITGESGTGKELVARGIHALSRRRHKAFIPVNVAALSETLLESELFGHEKGAFTGAIDTRKGLFELATGGTIFLDEIGEMPPQTQTKLLRVLEQQEFHRVGGQKLIQVNVRILAATNQRLEHLVVSGDFRKDLYYRLNVLTIALPPLRHRRDDIPRLVDSFIREAGERHDRGPFRGISDEAMRILVRHRWPGNVRELRNLVESMVVLAPGRQIRAEDIPEDVRSGEGSLAMVPVARPGRQRGDDGVQSLRPQLEFIFRTMMDMKVDIEDLRREFEDFQAEEERGRVLIGVGEGGRGADEVPAGAEIVVERGVGVADDAERVDEAGDLAGRQGSAYADEDTDPVDEELRTDARTPPDDEAGLEGGPDSQAADETLPEVDALPEDDPDSEQPSEQSLPPGTVGYRPGMTLEDMERDVIAAVLNSVEWNRRQAAEILGIGERTLYRKVRKYGLEEEMGDT
ncbi:MAG: sigma 54-interacting transcriptional regulator [Gemmatimonadota bacterium]|nr:sigma 54-interacting transcriptional regulator [Gemmatimonadota bacterium]